ncbi:hypothetical protein J6590_027587 [Homalodisca vitripennis]|nr:hypothetical protein J6590_027587 [Homalodisca vitripennis]
MLKNFAQSIMFSCLLSFRESLHDNVESQLNYVIVRMSRLHTTADELIHADEYLVQCTPPQSRCLFELDPNFIPLLVFCNPAMVLNVWFDRNFSKSI